MYKYLIVIVSIISSSVLLGQVQCDYFIDSRDGKKYDVVDIDGIIWMKQNLAYKPEKGKYWLYDNDSTNAKKYGYLYNWNTAMKVCPNGWELPSKNDFDSLINFAGGKYKAYDKLLNSKGENFNVQFAGWCCKRNGCGFKDINAYYWSSSTFQGRNKYLFYICSQNQLAFMHNIDRKVGLAVRCIKKN